MIPLHPAVFSSIPMIRFDRLLNSMQIVMKKRKQRL